MRGFSVRVGSIGGVDVSVNWSVFVIFGLLVWTLAVAGLPDLASGYSSFEYWTAATIATVAFFASLLAHEMSHCFAARRQGLRVRDVTLWLLGGVSTIEQEPQTAGGDFRVAIAGPAMSFAIAFGSLGVAALCLAAGLPTIVVASTAWLGSVNLLLAVFNLIPAAPLDGGRVLRAIRWRRTGDRNRAALDAARAGQVFAFVLVGLGFLEVLAGGAEGLWFLLLGWFVMSASRAEQMQIGMTRDLAGARVRDLMTPGPITVPADMTVENVLHGFVLARHCSTFPVLDEGARLVGLVTLGRLRSVAPPRRETTPVSAIAWPVGEFSTAEPDELVLDVLRRPATGGDGRIVVCQGDAVVGIVSPTDISRALQYAGVERDTHPKADA